MTAIAPHPNDSPITELTTASRTWSRAEIFRDPEGDFGLPPKTTDIFTPEFDTEIRREARWFREERIPELPFDQQKAVGRRLLPCPLCKGERVVWLLYWGEMTGLRMYRRRRCSCVFLQHFWFYWANIPERFQDVDFGSVVPVASDRISVERQATIIEALRAKPQDSYFLYGPAGTGKTHLATALYRAALYRSIEEKFRDPKAPNRLWRIGANALLQQFVEWETRDKSDQDRPAPAPTVTRRDIERAVKAGYKPSLFLDELDKIKATDYKLTVLCDIVDAVYAAKGQIVSTSNKGVAELAEKWGKDEAETIVRRIGGDEGGHLVFFGD